MTLIKLIESLNAVRAVVGDDRQVRVCNRDDVGELVQIQLLETFVSRDSPVVLIVSDIGN